MKTISKRELNQQTAHVLDAVSIGQPVVVTERGVPRWRIEAVESSGDTVSRLDRWMRSSSNRAANANALVR